jgi:hypothetical protein
MCPLNTGPNGSEFWLFNGHFRSASDVHTRGKDHGLSLGGDIPDERQVDDLEGSDSMGGNPPLLLTIAPKKYM